MRESSNVELLPMGEYLYALRSIFQREGDRVVIQLYW